MLRLRESLRNGPVGGASTAIFGSPIGWTQTLADAAVLANQSPATADDAMILYKRLMNESGHQTLHSSDATSFSNAGDVIGTSSAALAHQNAYFDLISPDNKRSLLLRALRRHLSSEMGFLIPPVHISDNLRLHPREYVFSLRGIEIGRWQLDNAQMLAVSGDPNRRPLPGRETREPAFGVPAIWIAPAVEEQAIAAGYSVVDANTVITTHLGEMIRRHAYELLGRAEAKRLMDSLNESHPKLLEELVPKVLTLGEVGHVLEQLLRERVSIRDLGSVLEALLEVAPVNKSLVALVESARQALGRRLIAPLLNAEGQLPVILLDASMEEEIVESLSPESSQRLLSPKSTSGIPLVRRLLDSLKTLISSSNTSVLPVLLCPSPARYHVKRWIEPLLPRLAVVAAAEIPPETPLKPVGTVR